MANTLLNTGIDDSDQSRMANALAGMVRPSPYRMVPPPAGANAAAPVWQGLGQMFVPHIIDPATYGPRPAPSLQSAPMPAPQMGDVRPDQIVVPQVATLPAEGPQTAGKVPDPNRSMGSEGIAADLGNIAGQFVGGPEAAIASGIAKGVAAAGKALPAWLAAARVGSRDALRDALLAGAPRAIPGAAPSTAEIAAQAVRDTSIVPPPPSGSMNPLDNVQVAFRGKSPMEMTPEEYKAFGEHYGVKNLGPLSPLQDLPDPSGAIHESRGISQVPTREFSVPGGTEGKWTYYDLTHMKANPINPSDMDRSLHAEMQRKLGRTMTPEGPLSDAQVWQGLMFGLTSPNNPLFPNQLASSRLRLRTPQLLDDLASMISWKPGDTVPQEVRNQANEAIAARYGLGEAPAGLGVRGTQEPSNIAELAVMFRDNPDFFRKKPDEDWGQAVERIASQVRGLKMKTGSLSMVWQDPAEAAISAIDRHMARELDVRGGLFSSPEERTAWENTGVQRWNKRNPNNQVSGWTELTQKSGSDGFIGERLLDHVGAASNPQFRYATGKVNPTIGEHLANATWAVEPKKVLEMGAAYKRALALNQQLADQSGLNLFMSQWMEWDRIRNRFEPHENMFPGLEKLPAPTLEQLRGVDAAHRQTGHKTYGKDEEMKLEPTRPLAGRPSQMGYFAPETR